MRSVFLPAFLLFVLVSATGIFGQCEHGAKLFPAGECVCVSSFSGALCDVAAPTPSCVAPVLAKSERYYPSVVENSVSFSGNVLQVTLSGPAVINRTYTEVKFRNSTSDSCSLGSGASMWAATFHSLSCTDRISLTLPWKNHTHCGFGLTSSASSNTAQFKGTVSMSFTDRIDSVLNTVLERKSKVYFDVYINFPKVLEVELDMVVVYSKVNLHFALTQFEFDAVADVMSVTVTTIVDWPNMLTAREMEVRLPGINFVLAEPVALIDQQCANVAGTNCQQTFKFKERLSSGCSFDGQYMMNFTVVTCRDEHPYNCTYEEDAVIFHVSNSDVCGEVALQPTISGVLAAVEENLVTPSAGYNLGTTAYFVTKIATGGADNDVTIVYKDISFEVTHADRKYVLKNFNNVTTNDIADDVRLNVNNELYAFSIYLTGEHFELLPRETKSYTFRATAKVTFAGNEHGKRHEEEVEMVFQAPAEPRVVAVVDVRITNAVQLSSDKDAAIVSMEESKPFANMTVVLSAAGALLGVALVVVASVVYRKRNTSQAVYAQI